MENLGRIDNLVWINKINRIFKINKLDKSFKIRWFFWIDEKNKLG